MLERKMYGLSYEGDKYRNIQVNEIASTGLEFNNWMRCLGKQCFLLQQFSNGGWMFQNEFYESQTRLDDGKETL